MHNYFNKKGGAALNTFVLFLLVCALGYFGYISFRAKGNIMIYDMKGVDVVLPMPPYSERLTDADRELFGECDINVGTTFEQCCEFYKSFCAERGFAFDKPKKKADIFTIETRKGFLITAEFMSNQLRYRWIPELTVSQRKKCTKLFGSVKTKPEEE